MKKRVFHLYCISLQLNAFSCCPLPNRYFYKKNPNFKHIILCPYNQALEINFCHSKNSFSKAKPHRNGECTLSN